MILCPLETMDEFVAFSTGKCLQNLYISCIRPLLNPLFCFHLDESFLSNNSSLSGGTSDRNAVYSRFSELEKKITEQADEIVCLKSTLADVLRRLSQLEGRGECFACLFLLTR